MIAFATFPRPRYRGKKKNLRMEARVGDDDDVFEVYRDTCVVTCGNVGMEVRVGDDNDELPRETCVPTSGNENEDGTIPNLPIGFVGNVGADFRSALLKAMSEKNESAWFVQGVGSEKNRGYSDLTVCFVRKKDGKIAKALAVHKLVLVNRSEIFDAMFSENGMSESQRGGTLIISERMGRLSKDGPGSSREDENVPKSEEDERRGGDDDDYDEDEESLFFEWELLLHYLYEPRGFVGNFIACVRKIVTTTMRPCGIFEESLHVAERFLVLGRCYAVKDVDRTTTIMIGNLFAMFRHDRPVSDPSPLNWTFVWIANSIVHRHGLSGPLITILNAQTTECLKEGKYKGPFHFPRTASGTEADTDRILMDMGETLNEFYLRANALRDVAKTARANGSEVMKDVLQRCEELTKVTKANGLTPDVLNRLAPDVLKLLAPDVLNRLAPAVPESVSVRQMKKRKTSVIGGPLRTI